MPTKQGQISESQIKLTISFLLWGVALEESDLVDAVLFQDPLEPQKNGVELGEDQDCAIPPGVMPLDDVEEDPLFRRELVGLAIWIQLLILLLVASQQVLEK